MARNATKKGPKQLDQEKHPDLVHQQLELSKRLACYNFWQYLYTEAEEGWSPTDKPGSLWKYRSSNYIKQNIKQTSWAKIGKSRNYTSGPFERTTRTTLIASEIYKYNDINTMSLAYNNTSTPSKPFMVHGIISFASGPGHEQFFHYSSDAYWE
eukprot:jgi/Psemu1/22492/gm1.22492_g